MWSSLFLPYQPFFFYPHLRPRGCSRRPFRSAGNASAGVPRGLHLRGSLGTPAAWASTGAAVTSGQSTSDINVRFKRRKGL